MLRFLESNWKVEGTVFRALLAPSLHKSRGVFGHSLHTDDVIHSIAAPSLFIVPALQFASR